LKVVDFKKVVFFNFKKFYFPSIRVKKYWLGTFVFWYCWLN